MLFMRNKIIDINELTSRVETVLWGSEWPGNKVSTTIAGMPELICSSAACPPSAAAAVRACSKSTAPTKARQAESFSYVLTPGRTLSSESATAWRTSCSVNGTSFLVERARVKWRFRGVPRVLVERE